MPHSVTWLGRLRIERLVWTLDQQLYDLPNASRVAARREVRGNLLEAARDVGVRQALRNLGGSRRLAEGYLTAQYGDRPRHSWIAAAYFLALVPFVTNFFFDAAGDAYQQAITDLDPHVTGTFTWDGVSFLQNPATFTFTDGQASQAGGYWSPLFWVLCIVGTVLAGRLWRLFRKARDPRPA
jgi:hypothetical protein